MLWHGSAVRVKMSRMAAIPVARREEAVVIISDVVAVAANFEELWSKVPEKPRILATW
jgi:hypothetical protein